MMSVLVKHRWECDYCLRRVDTELPEGEASRLPDGWREIEQPAGRPADTLHACQYCWYAALGVGGMFAVPVREPRGGR